MCRMWHDCSQHCQPCRCTTALTDPCCTTSTLAPTTPRLPPTKALKPSPTLISLQGGPQPGPDPQDIPTPVRYATPCLHCYSHLHYTNHSWISSWVWTMTGTLMATQPNSCLLTKIQAPHFLCLPHIMQSCACDMWASAGRA